MCLITLRGIFLVNKFGYKLIINTLKMKGLKIAQSLTPEKASSIAFNRNNKNSQLMFWLKNFREVICSSTNIT
jgi:hypothetical protein